MVEGVSRGNTVLIFHLLMTRVARIAARARGAGRVSDVVGDCL